MYYTSAAFIGMDLVVRLSLSSLILSPHIFPPAYFPYIQPPPFMPLKTAEHTSSNEKSKNKIV